MTPRKKIDSKEEAKQVKRDQWRQRVIRWAEFLCQLEHLGQRAENMAKDGIITDDETKDIWDHLMSARDVLLTDGPPLE